MQQPFDEYARLQGLAIYRVLRDAWETASVDREVTFAETVFAPIEPGYANVGAAIFFATLAFPLQSKRRVEFAEAIAAACIKQWAPPGSPRRKRLREDPSAQRLFQIPNKRIDERLAAGKRRISSRLRAAWVIWQKIISNPDPVRQAPLIDFMRTAASQNTRSYPAFCSTQADPEDSDEAVIDSFRRQVMNEARAVLHVAMAFYIRFETGERRSLNLLAVVNRADEWLKPTLIAAEILRVSLGDLLPRYDSQYHAERSQNFSVPLNQTIAVLPYIDPIDPAWNFHDLLSGRLQEQVRRATKATDPQRQHPSKRGRRKKIGEAEQHLLREIVREKPKATLDEIRAAFSARTGVSVHNATLREALREAGIRGERAKEVKSSRGKTEPQRTRDHDAHRHHTAAQGYASSLTDAEWALVAELFESDDGRGVPPRYPRRLLVDACRYVLRTGCAWRSLPESFPPWQNVYRTFQRWQAAGKFDAMDERLRQSRRVRKDDV